MFRYVGHDEGKLIYFIDLLISQRYTSWCPTIIIDNI